MDNLNFEWRDGLLLPTDDAIQYCTECTAKYKFNVAQSMGTCMACTSLRTQTGRVAESKDDTLPFPKGGDHDEEYVFGRVPTSAWPFPFTAQQYARLLILRGRVRSEKETQS